MAITFPPTETLDGMRMVVSFPADKDEDRILCAISFEALEDNFRGNGIPPLDCFRANRASIEEMAARFISQGRFEPDGSILIRSQDGA